MNPIVRPRPADGFVQAQASATATKPVATGLSLDDESSIAIGDAAHRQDIGDRFAVSPVRVQRTGAYDSHPLLRVTETLEGLVARRGEDRHRPRAVIARECEQRNRAECGQASARGGRAAAAR